MLKQMPLRTRLALGYTAFFGLVLALLGVGVVLSVRSALLDEMKRELQTSGELIAQDFDASNAGLTQYFRTPESLLRTRPLRIEGLEAPALYVQIATTTGEIVTTSANLQQQSLPFDDDQRVISSGVPEIEEIDLGGSPVLMLVRPLIADEQVVGVLQVAQPLREIYRTLRLLSISVAGLSLIALLAALRGGAWLAQRTLLPVAQVAQTARQIVRAEDLGQRVPAASGSDELGQLTATVNEMLERLETLFTAQRRFVADVSHELRTPLTAMLGNLELIRRGAANDPQAFAAMERELNRLRRLVSDLLLLAQTESGVQLRHEPVALDELVLEVVRDLAPLVQDVALLPDVAEQVEAPGDRDRIKQALMNMVVNALQHTLAGGKVRVALDRCDDCARLSVRDTGIGIDAEDLPHVFERFFRADKARTRTSGGAGLGLAIVKWVAEAHGGRVEVYSAPDQGSTFTLWLPLDSEASLESVVRSA
jgi:two-component system OmpR family sensor kinase